MAHPRKQERVVAWAFAITSFVLTCSAHNKND